MDPVTVALIAFAAYWVGWAVGRGERPDPRPWPAAEDCEPRPPLARRILPHLPTHDERTSRRPVHHGGGVGR